MTTTPNRYTPGQRVRITGEFTDDETGVLADPTAVTMHARSPRGTLLTLAVVRESAGIYYAELDTSDLQAGTWTYRVASTGDGQTAREGTFILERTAFH